MKNFVTRAITGIVYAAVMIFGISYDSYPFFIIGLAAFLQFMCTKELFALSKKMFPDHHFPPVHFFLSVISSLLFLVVLLVGDTIAYIPLLILPVIYMTQLVITEKKIIPSIITSIFSILYIGIPVMLMVELKYMNSVIPLAVLFMIWINDTMAYITGSLIGKTPLSQISPKKTVEGTAGGVVFTMIFAALFGLLYKDAFFPFWIWMIMGLLVGIFGNAGDLFESFLKRKSGVKDSGNILPGHGGILDRLDSLLFVFPVIYVFIYLISVF